MLARALQCWQYFMEKNWMVTEMVQADVTVGEISTFQHEKCLVLL